MNVASRISPLAYAACVLAGPTGAFAAGAPVPEHAGACGAPLTGPKFIDPPNVDISMLPRDADSDPELVMTVHRDGDRFCYRYGVNGDEQTTSPTLRVHAGDRFALRIVNDISTPSPGEFLTSEEIPACKPMTMPVVSGTTFVGYLNHAGYERAMQMKPEDTNIHLHGYQGPAAAENVFLSSLGTPVHACEYRVAIPRGQWPGTYFYHAHAHGMSEAQMSGGLSGVWIVDPQTTRLDRSDDHVVIIRDSAPEVDDNPPLLDPLPILQAAMHHGMVQRTGRPVSYDPFNPPPWPSTIPIEASHEFLDTTGCTGVFASPLVTINGLPVPVTLSAPIGRTQLLRLVNATSNSTKLVRLRDAVGQAIPFSVVARDGIPFSGNSMAPLSQYVAMDSILLPPAGRADVLVTAKPGQKLTLYSDHVCLGAMGEYTGRHDLIALEPVPSAKAATIESKAASIDAPASELLSYARAHPELVRRRAITFTAHVFPSTGKRRLQGAFYITDTTDPNFHEHPFWPAYRSDEMVPANADIVVKQGTIEEWYLFNTMIDTHAFHIHQMAFVEEDDPSGVPVMLDTVFVPSGTILPNPKDPSYPLIKPALVKVLLDFRQVPRGTFVFHCHMLAHEDRGMMGTIRVE